MMRILNTCAIALMLVAATARADSIPPSANSDCRDEALSTGLEQEADILAYVEQCMQRYAGLGDDYTTPIDSYPMEMPVEVSPAEVEAAQ